MQASITEAKDVRHDRVRANTKREINQQIDEKTVHLLRLYSKADKDLIASRIEQLDREWDIERLLETNAASIALGGIILGTVSSRKWFLVPAVVATFLLQHAIQGWCPPVTALRRFGVRTRKEIERERYALKLLRGDFEEFRAGETQDVEQLLRMLDADAF
jgi:hypothetical protein